MVKENFVNYKHYRWFWLNLFFLTILIIMYMLDDPLGGRRGDTPLGYFYGVLATVGIFVLTWFGRRKRAYKTHRTTLMGWLSAHIWIGLVLIILVPLHCGFEFGTNVHTLAYVLMLATILSGVWGAFNYVQYANQIQSHRGGARPEEILENLLKTEKELRILEQGKSDKFLRMVDYLYRPFKPSVRWALFSSRNQEIISSEKLTKLIGSLENFEHEAAFKTVGLVSERNETADKLKHEITVDCMLKLWLYFHIPLASGLVISLIIHIYSVFYYW